MTEETKEGYPEGTVKTVHSDLDVFKLNTKIKNKDGNPIGKTGKGVKIVYTDPYGTQTLQLPAAKFEGKVLSIANNKKVWKELNDPALAEAVEEEEVCTLTFVKGKDFWDFDGIVPGEVGTPGIVKPGSTTQGPGNSGGSGGGGYNNLDAQAGQIINLATTIASTSLKAKQALTMGMISEVAGDLVDDYLELKDSLKKQLGGSTASASASETNGKAGDSEDDDFEDDNPEAPEDAKGNSDDEDDEEEY